MASADSKDVEKVDVENPKLRPQGNRRSENIRSFFKYNWQLIFIALSPILLSFVMFANDDPDKVKAFRCLYVVLIMSSFWVTEAMPTPITGMIPMVAFPLMDILDTDSVCVMYMKDTMVMFIGGLIIAEAIEYCHLHKRMALKVIIVIGCSQRKLTFGFSAVTMFASMWISNTAVIAMMCPILLAVLEEFDRLGICKMYLDEKPTKEGETTEERETRPPVPSKITRCYFIGAAYSATLGGSGTLVGSAVNLTFKGLYELSFPNAPPIDFTKWLFYNFPSAVILTILTWVYLQWMYMGMFRPNSREAKEADIGEEGERVARNVIEQRYNDLGPISTHEKWIAFFFLFAITLFFFRAPGFMKGWPELLGITVNVKDSTPAVLVVILFFMLPTNWNCFRFFYNPAHQPLQTSQSSRLLSWNAIHSKTPWSLIFMLGGGFALAEGGKASGMTKMLGASLAVFQDLPYLALLFLICLACSVLTEFTSNVAITNVVLPVLAEMSINIGIHPMLLMYPAALCCSFAFHMPVGTPPNAIVAEVGHIRTKDLVVAGIGPTLFCLIVVWAMFPTWGKIVYPEVSEYPDWINATVVKHILSSRSLQDYRF